MRLTELESGGEMLRSPSREGVRTDDGIALLTFVEREPLESGFATRSDLAILSAVGGVNEGVLLGTVEVAPDCLLNTC